MQGNANTQAGAKQVAQRQSHERGTYQKVYGPGKRRIRGLWQRNGSFYGRLAVEDETTGIKSVKRVRLEDSDGNPVSTVPAAIKVLASLTTKRDESTLALAPKRTPVFSEYALAYFGWLDAVKTAKSERTVASERESIIQWNRHFGGIRLNAITPAVLMDFQRKRSKEGVSPRTVNLQIIAVRNILKRAQSEGLLRTVPNVAPLKVTTERRRLLSADELDRLCNVAVEGWTEKDKATGEARTIRPRNGQEFADFVRLMCYAGGRWRETLSVKWADVDFDRRQLHFRAAETKSGKSRVVDFNAELAAHLEAMRKHRAPDTEYLFPSPRFSTRDTAAQSFRGTLQMVRKAARVPDFTAHLCRHYFISRAVMSGIDFMTIAGWAGHADGGVLIGKVYGHLADEHRRNMADRLTFAPQIVKAVNH